MSAQQSPPLEAQAWYQAEYDFYRKIIEDEVARLRWNGGFEPLAADLYKSPQAQGRWVGRTRICHRDFSIVVTETFDSQGRQILKLSVHAIPR